MRTTITSVCKMRTLASALCAFFILLQFNSCKEETTMKEKPKTALTDAQIIEKAKGIHERVITLDTHCDINVNNFTDSINYTQDLDAQVTLPKMIKGGLDVAWFIVYTGQDSLNADGYEKAYKNAMSKFDAIHKLTEEIAPDQIELATTSADVRRIQKAGKKVAMIGVENAYPIGTDIKNVEKFYNLGARYMSLSHNGHSQLCDSNTGEAENDWLHNGLSDFGKEVLVEMNRLGIMIDVSHPSKTSMKQMIELSKAPIIASHSSARALCDHSRNLDDEQLQWMKENGGVIQTVAFTSYVNTEKNEARNDKLKEIREFVADSMGIVWHDWNSFGKLDEAAQMEFIKNRKTVMDITDAKANEIENFPPSVDVSDFVDHIDYMVEKIGLKHVGISSDFDGGGGVKGWNDASETFNVTLELVRRGYTEEDIDKLWSGNLLRVLDEVEAVANSLK